MDLTRFEKLFEKKLMEMETGDDPAHDLLHFKRVVKTAKMLCEQEGALSEIVVPAAWLHDFIVIPKNDPRRSQASRISAEAALEFLREIDYPADLFPAIAHAIMCHSFSANIKAESLEAKIVQDADRLDGLGAIGIARLFATAGIMKSSFYSLDDPFVGEKDSTNARELTNVRELNDKKFAVDHFYKKLFKTASTLQTAAGRLEGEKRMTTMKSYLSALAEELGST